MFRVGEIVSSTALDREYDTYFAQVLGEHLQLQPREKRQRKKYKILNQLPSKQDYNALKVKRFTTTVDSLIEDAYQTVSDLADEMQEAADNTPESLKGGDVGQRREEAASELQNFDKPDVPTFCEGLAAVFFPHKDATSRPKRAIEAADMMTTAATTIREAIEEIEEDSDTDVSELESLCDQLEEDASNLEGIDFPGMYG